jgi:hypothetical protein
MVESDGPKTEGGMCNDTSRRGVGCGQVHSHSKPLCEERTKECTCTRSTRVSWGKYSVR